jgi:hypothetical protein
MKIFVGAGPEAGIIFLLCPGRIVELMGCVEKFFSANINH